MSVIDVIIQQLMDWLVSLDVGWDLFLIPFLLSSVTTFLQIYECSSLLSAKQTEKTKHFQLANHIHLGSFLSNMIQWKPEIPCNN